MAMAPPAIFFPPLGQCLPRAAEEAGFLGCNTGAAAFHCNPVASLQPEQVAGGVEQAISSDAADGTDQLFVADFFVFGFSNIKPERLLRDFRLFLLSI